MPSVVSFAAVSLLLVMPGPLRAVGWLEKVAAVAEVRWDTAARAAVQHQLNGAGGGMSSRITCLDEWFLNTKEKVGGARARPLLTIPMNSPGFDLHFRAKRRVEAEEESPGEEREQTAGRSRDNGGERTMAD